MVQAPCRPLLQVLQMLSKQLPELSCLRPKSASTTTKQITIQIQRYNFITTLIRALVTNRIPMISAGALRSHTQLGNTTSRVQGSCLPPPGNDSHINHHTPCSLYPIYVGFTSTTNRKFLLICLIISTLLHQRSSLAASD